MTEVKSGDTVRIHYVGSFTDGNQFDSSLEREPLEFVVGAGQIIPGLDQALPGMTEGDRKTVNVPAAEAYGDVNPDARQSIPRAQIPEDVSVEVGTELQMQTQDGRAIPVRVIDADDQSVVLDANHPLAGRDLVFAIELVSVN